MIKQANEVLVSIVLPVYNGEKFLKQSIESVLKQTHKNLELIIVNDCSTDNSLSIANSFEKQDPRVKVISNQVNQKLPESLNIGFRNANGDYYTWTSDDNWYEPTAIEDMLNYLLEKNDKDMVCADMTVIHEDDHALDNVFIADPRPEELIKNNKCGACFMWSKEIGKAVGEYDKSKFLAEDYDYWLRIGLIGEIGHLQKNLYNYRLHSNNLTAKRKSEIEKCANKIKSIYIDKYAQKYPNLISNKSEKIIMTDSTNTSIPSEIIEDITQNVLGTRETTSESNLFIRRLLKKASMPDGIFRKGNVRFYLPNYPRDKSQTFIVDNNNFNEFFALDILNNYLNDESVIVDVGAFIGNHSLYWAINNNARKVYAFEPLLENYKILKKNIKINKLKGVVIAKNVALGDKNGIAVVDKYATLDMASTTFKNIEDDVEINEEDIKDGLVKPYSDFHKRVNGTHCYFETLDEQEVFEDKIDLLKIDTNGNEGNVLKGGEQFIKRHSPKLILIDTNTQDSLDKCTAILGDYGYNEIQQLPGFRKLYSSEDVSKFGKHELNNLDRYQAAKKWIQNHTIDNKGIVVTSLCSIIYPEVTGYYIPTLLKYGDKKRAINFANYLLSIQNDDGSWSDPSKKNPYTFDTGMILKGLLALIKDNLDNEEKYKTAFIRGADWIINQKRSDGSISTPDTTMWELPFGNKVPEAIHLYTLSAIKEFADLYDKKEYLDFVNRAMEFYLKDPTLTDLNTLSHFNAYIIEALIDLGQIQRAQSAMDKIAKLQTADGAIRAYNNVEFVCSTAMFQYAVCWFKLGNIELGRKTFEYASKLQNQSGGWYGSYGANCNYFPEAEISWAVKYYLDAIYYMQLESYRQSEEALSDISPNDGRYKCLEDLFDTKQISKFLDLGCGKARYTKQLLNKCDKKNRVIKFYGVDLKANIMKDLPKDIICKEGSILQIPCEDNVFDFVFLSESLEHAIDIDNAIDEISRVMTTGGTLLVIDKDELSENSYMKAPFEQWFGKESFIKLLKTHGFKASVKTDITGNSTSGYTFNAWIAVKQ